MSLDCDESDIVLVYDSDVGIPKPESRGLNNTVSTRVYCTVY